MISKISIQNFKSLKNITFECSNLNLLTGLNGMGKSSVLQALLLLRQSFDKGYLEKSGITLNGDLVNIGVGKDALYQNAEKEEITFNASFLQAEGTINNSWIFGYEKDSDVLLFAEDAFKNSPKPENLEILALFNSQFKYLHAERWVRNQYPRSDFQVVQNRSVGKHGEFAAHFLNHFGEETIDSSLLYPGSSTNTLDYQVSAWMNEISPGTKVKTEKIRGVEAIKLSYDFPNNNGRTDEITPGNVGFGITYVLSVIVLLLCAKPGEILLIENPESNLHPKGQSAIGHLMALVAQKGVQIFVESHSDHILNGILIAISNNYKNGQGGIQSSNVKIYFFDIENERHESISHKIEIHENGRISKAPKNFFDQFSKDMKTIMGF
jgi:predicted ATPase